MAGNDGIDFIFFDIGGTLGESNSSNNGLTPFPSSIRLLQAMRDVVGLRIGVITTLGPTLTNDEGLALLNDAGIAPFLDPHGFVSDHDAGVAKPDKRIYQHAARQVGVDITRCLFVGESLIEVLGAIAGGMKAVLKPCPPGRDVG